MSVGWILTYAKGPATWVPIIQRLYAGPLILALALGALVLGIWKGPNPRLHMLIAAWAIPFGVYVLYAIAIKPTHFFLPIVLPILSSMPVFLEHGPQKAPGMADHRMACAGAAATVAVVNGYILRRTSVCIAALEREATSAPIVFYRTIEEDFLTRIGWMIRWWW
jgi:hypothetical protein